jgi:hypothetical protein
MEQEAAHQVHSVFFIAAAIYVPIVSKAEVLLWQLVDPSTAVALNEPVHGVTQ